VVDLHTLRDCLDHAGVGGLSVYSGVASSFFYINVAQERRVLRSPFGLRSMSFWHSSSCARSLGSSDTPPLWREINWAPRARWFGLIRHAIFGSDCWRFATMLGEAVSVLVAINTKTTQGPLPHCTNS
jgi:hypothetical protein